MILMQELSAIKLLTLGYSVIPSGGGDTGKAPLIAWTKYQDEFPDETNIDKWEREFNPSLWGVVTGYASGVVIIDIDDPAKKTIFDRAGLQPHIKTPRGGYHYWFKHPGGTIKTCAGILPGVDVRGDGGFVNVIGKRKDGEYETLIVPVPDQLYPWEKLPNEIFAAMNSNGKKPAQIKDAQLHVIPQGQRNTELASIAGSMRARGLSETAIESALLAINQQSCDPPLDDDEVTGIARSVSRYAPQERDNPYMSHTYAPARARNTNVTQNVTDSVTERLSERVEKFIRDTTGWLTHEEIDKELGIHSSKDKDNRRQIIKRLREDGTIEVHPKENKKLRYINKSIRTIDFKNFQKSQPIELLLPFKTEQFINIYPGNLVVVAGAPDAGKTAFLLNIVHLNQFKHEIYYQSSEMEENEFVSRLEKFDDIAIDEWNFTPEKRASDFADVIRPDSINIVDYLELTTDLFMVADYLRAIWEKLTTGIAIVAIQKKRGADLGRGGEFSLEKPRLYLSMDAGSMTIQKAKNWKDPTRNPNGYKIDYKIVGGCKFMVTKGWYKDESKL